MCVIENCTNKNFSGGKCLRHYRYDKYGNCQMDGCHSPACGKDGLCDNCARRGAPKRRHYGKHINDEKNKYCEGCKTIKSRLDFYVDRGNSSYLCKQCHYERRTVAQRRSQAYEYGMKNIVQTSAHLCVKCWSPLSSWEADHIVPYSIGGTHDVETNIQIMCRRCNRTKSNNESIDYRVFKNFD